MPPFKTPLLAIFAVCAALGLANDASLTIRADRKTFRLNPSMHGIFFEEINQGGEGGVYAELLRTRGMEDGSGTTLASGWKTFGSGGTATMDPTVRLNDARPHSLKIVRTGTEPFGVENAGFWGIPTRTGQRLKLLMWVRAETPARAVLTGTPAVEIRPQAGWQRIERTLVAGATNPRATLRIEPTSPGSLHVAFASLMPVDTWKGRPNGLRSDLAEKIAAMKPGFVRFPGGCFVEGHDLAQAWNWKDSIGPLEARRGMSRILWGYPTSNGLGFHEMLQWCEDLGAEMLFVANCGMSHSETMPMTGMDRYVQDALDAIEYANGPATSRWGAERAKNGRPKPFGLKYVQIGNENGGPAYDERYALLYRAIKAKYPEMRLVANVWGGVPQSAPLEIIDEHHYANPSWFWRNATRFDRYPRRGPEIYVGEYAVTRGSGTGNLAGALAEAAFMTGMERNGDLVRMGSYAPLLVNVNNRQWNPNAIVYDAHRAYGTPSYWVQRVFAHHLPTRGLSHAFVAPAPALRPLTGRIGLQTWRTSAEFRDLKLEADGKILFAPDDLTEARLDRGPGNWILQNGVLSQTSLDENRRLLVRDLRLPEANRLTLTLKARKVAGNEGFILMLGVDPDHEFQWNLGGWGNVTHAFQIDGERVGRGADGSIPTGEWMDIRLEREGNVTRGYLNGKLIETLPDQPVPDCTAVAGFDEKTGEIIVKAVNGATEPRRLQLDILGVRVGTTARRIVIEGASLSDENSFEASLRIAPRESLLRNLRNRQTLALPARSLTILRIPTK